MADSPEPNVDAERDPAQALRDWSPAERLRPPQPAVDWSRRRVALILVLIALLYPFYAAGVERLLLRMELERASREFERVAAEARSELAAQQARQAEHVRAIETLAAERDLRAQINAVRVTGVVEGSPPSVVVDHIPPAGAAMAAAVVCRQASALLRRPLQGEAIRVMRDLGARPVADAGTVICP
jgi:hypothetical protein